MRHHSTFTCGLAKHMTGLRVQVLQNSSLNTGKKSPQQQQMSTLVDLRLPAHLCKISLSRL